MDKAPTQMVIREACQRLKHVINVANEEWGKLRDICPHPDATKKYGSNTGNYDSGSDCWWIDFRCPDCGKYWTEEQ